MPRLTKNAPKKAKKQRVQEEMHKFKEGKLHSGSKTGPKVKSRKQAIAIAMSESGQALGQAHRKKGPSPPDTSKNANAFRKKKTRRARNMGRS